jgi:hypothetical protein
MTKVLILPEVFLTATTYCEGPNVGLSVSTLIVTCLEFLSGYLIETSLISPTASKASSAVRSGITLTSPLPDSLT